MGKHKTSMFEAFRVSEREAAEKAAQRAAAIAEERAALQRRIAAEKARLEAKNPTAPPAAGEGSTAPSVDELTAAGEGLAASPASDGAGERAQSKTRGAAAAATASRDGAAGHATTGRGLADSASVPRSATSPGASPTAPPTSSQGRFVGAPRIEPEGATMTLPCSTGTFVVVQLALLVVAFYLGVLTTRDLSGGGNAGADVANGEMFPTQPPSTEGLGLTGRAAGPSGSATDPRHNAAGAAGDPQGAAPAADGNRTSPTLQPPARPVDDPALKAFLDPKNVFTLQLVSYDDTPRARSTAEHWQGILRDAGYAAVLYPVRSRLSLFVGASPNAIEIDELARRVKAVRDTQGRPAFPDPRPVMLSDFR